MGVEDLTVMQSLRRASTSLTRSVMQQQPARAMAMKVDGFEEIQTVCVQMIQKCKEQGMSKAEMEKMSASHPAVRAKIIELLPELKPEWLELAKNAAKPTTK